jgi:predicted nuclease with TOPRIM domain
MLSKQTSDPLAVARANLDAYYAEITELNQRKRELRSKEEKCMKEQVLLDFKREYLWDEKVRLDVEQVELTNRWMRICGEYDDLEERIQGVEDGLYNAAKKWVAVKEGR